MVDEKCDVDIEVQEDHLLIVFSRKMDDFIMPWQDAMRLGQAIEMAAQHIPKKPLIVLPTGFEFEEQKIKLAKFQGKFVVLVFDHTDRLKLSYEAARVLGRSMREQAQDMMLKQEKGVHILYNVKHREGRPTPAWDANRLPKTIPTN
jgi:hypothetical protein